MEPFQKDQLLIVPGDRIGRYLYVEEELYIPADPEVGIPDPYYRCDIAVMVHGKIEYFDLKDVEVAE